jgi:hypothetical protein
VSETCTGGDVCNVVYAAAAGETNTLTDFDPADVSVTNCETRG